ncbi:hypothetical protein AVEN_49828-1 [Araneus ventricosus]|uniref:Uncharacterized protein n=1 Tax=Araneus ventricosus TaxID=182803 RepID=A0A4Y2Q4E3_ARAVE|nr:hypothetical protein AVEN_49828-1 [Araneus ventricosus]
MRKVDGTFKVISDLMKYLELHWILYVYQKMFNIFLGKQQGLKKLPCCLCMCDSLARKKHCTLCEWLEVGMPNTVPSSNNSQQRDDSCFSTSFQVSPDYAVCENIQC